MVTAAAAQNTELQYLLMLALNGNARAYEQFLKELAPQVRRVVHYKIGQNADVEDIVQDILLSVHKARHTYDPARPLKPWLASIIHYRVTDWLRSHYARREQTHIAIEDVMDFLAADVTHNPSDHEYIHKAVAKLSDSQQQVISAMYQQDLSVAEAAATLGMSVSSVKVTAHRAYKKLRTMLEE